MHWIDPACLPETKGRVTQFLLNPHGEPDGCILDGRRQVHFPPHLGAQILAHVAPGDIVTVRGVKPRAADMVAAVSIGVAEGETIVDEGPDHEPEKRHEKAAAEPAPMEIAGTVAMSLHGPKGELRGALLEDGTSLRMPPHAAAELAEYLTPGASVHAWGHGVKNAHGCTVEVDEIAHAADPETERETQPTPQA